MTAKLAPLPQVTTPWVDAQGRPTIAFMQFMQAQAANTIGPLTAAADDASAAKAGVPVNGLYQASGVVRVRVS